MVRYPIIANISYEGGGISFKNMPIRCKKIDFILYSCPDCFLAGNRTKIIGWIIQERFNRGYQSLREYAQNIYMANNSLPWTKSEVPLDLFCPECMKKGKRTILTRSSPSKLMLYAGNDKTKYINLPLLLSTLSLRRWSSDHFLAKAYFPYPQTQADLNKIVKAWADITHQQYHPQAKFKLELTNLKLKEIERCYEEYIFKQFSKKL